MFQQFDQNRDRHLGFSLFFLLMATLLLCFFPATSNAEETVTEVSCAPCKGLESFNGLDELLYQFYTNLESSYLVEWPVEELESVWV